MWRDTGESYQNFLTKLAQASGIETPTAAEQIGAVCPDGDGLAEVVGDKGYHSNQSLVDLEAVGVRRLIAAPCFPSYPSAHGTLSAAGREVSEITGDRGEKRKDLLPYLPYLL